MEEEQKRIGAGYIFNFYNDVQALTNYYAEYRNNISSLKRKYPALMTASFKDDDDKSLEAIDMQTILNAANNVMFCAHKAYVSFKTTMPLFSNTPEDIQKDYDKIKNSVLPDVDAVESFVLSLNSLVFSEKVQNILTSQQDIINQLYGNNTGNNAEKK